MNDSKVEYLVVDTGPFLKAIQVNTLGKQLFTTPDVIMEIKDKYSRESLDILGLQIKTPTEQSIKAVIEFSKKTGDFSVLSITDLRIIALTYDLELQYNGKENIRSVPLEAVTQVGGRPKQPNVEEIKAVDNKEDDITMINSLKLTEELDPKDNDDEGGWITPNNIKKVKSLSGGNVEGNNNSNLSTIKVACLTTDFAMQNVILHLGLKLVSVDGMQIKILKNFVLRCHACFHVTKEMGKKFCPNCGNHSTLLRTSFTTNPETGEIHYHLKRNFQYNLRGTVYSIPNSMGGKKGAFKDLVLREDQKEFESRKLKAFIEEKKNTKNSVGVFDVEYIPTLVSGRKSGKGSQRHMDKGHFDQLGLTVGYGRKNPNANSRKTR
jgi:RNA-binding protein NOB1